ncbi:helix-turn-helix domain-containing protein [Pseudoflavonifractor phocaeensis]|uniref:helix-turn-helix domain-containing protein n=1 Tax=Pseudoflavonifractor phocaeensis TaxID=1870988 RepID=UPI00195A167F|nr:helix-turn-helix transcriptional regulator [Pseudoflavonifractor phocaeensis]MBM6925719.1 helix-turn-helix transcriptional regulator [Pseudoflavonifractor phocaeensis]
MSFGTNLQFLRDQAGMTQEGLAEALQVSRQSVSKWESDASFPEMEKLLILCDLFHTDLDTLLRQDVSQKFYSDTVGYDRFMNWFSNWVAFSIGLIILSVAFGLGCRGWFGAPEIAVPAVLLSGVAVAVAILIVAGMRYDRFEKEHPTLQDFYTKEERERYLNRFPFLIALPVAGIIIGTLWLVLLGEWAEQRGERAEMGLVAGFLAVVAVAVTVLVWAALRKGKYDIEAWNKQHNPSPEELARQKKAGWVCGAIMIAATVIYMIVGFGSMAAVGDYSGDWGWRWGWIVYPIAGVICALVSHLIEKEEDD